MESTKCLRWLPINGKKKKGKQAQQPAQINAFKILLKVPASTQIMKMNRLFLSDFSFLLYIEPTSWSGS